MDDFQSDKSKWRKWCSLCGSFLIFVPNGFSMYWGNLSVYMYSYIYVIKKVDPLQNQAPWLISLNIIARNVGILSSGKAIQLIGPRPTLILAILIFNTGIALSYWTVSFSTWSLNLSLGVLTGLGIGLLHAVVMVYAINWSGNGLGFLTSAVMTGYTIGPAMINQGITLFLNPANEVPDKQAGSVVYFSQNDILESVPMIFIFLAIFSLTFNFLGFLIIKDYQNSKDNTVKEGNYLENIKDIDSFSDQKYSMYKYSKLPDTETHLTDDEKEGSRPTLEQDNSSLGTQKIYYTEVFISDLLFTEEKANQNQPHPDENCFHEVEPSYCDCLKNPTAINADAELSKPFFDSFKSYERLENQTEAKYSNCCHLTDKVSQQLKHNNSILTGLNVIKNKGDLKENHVVDKSLNSGLHRSLLNLFRTKEFYVLLVMMITTELVSLILYSYYKTFGQCWIEDDHNLTNLGTVLSIATSVVKLIWGFILDRFGMKIPALLSITTLTTISSFYYFTPGISKWLFFATTLIFGCANSAVFTCFHTGVMKLLGKSNYSFTFGILSTSTIALNLLAPPIVEVILTRYGWFWLFLGTGVPGLVSIVLVLILLPSD